MTLSFAYIQLGIRAFKSFLDKFSPTQVDHAERVAILKEYLESQMPSDEENESTAYLSDFMQAWRFASHSKDEHLLSAIPAILALLLKTLSGLFELSKFGLRLGRTVLQNSQQRLIALSLIANRSKEFVISPALRLLRELTIFDGGALARLVFRSRDHLYTGLVRNLNLRFTGNTIESQRKSSVRSNAVRFVLGSIKFLPVDQKRELLSQRDIVSALTKDIKDDPPFLVRDILETLKTYVLQDEALPRDAKSKVANPVFLGRVALLYRYDAEEDGPSLIANKPVNELTHDFLLLACTTPNLGVLTRQSGFYPQGIDPDDSYNIDADNSFIDLGFDSVEWLGQFTDKVPVRNAILSDFIQNVRPWSSTKQSDLLISIFKAAPELVADYFLSKGTFTFDPTLTATWVGYSAFIFSVLQLPVPKYFGHLKGYARLPPPTSIVMQNILPQPLSQKVLMRCLNQPHKLIVFFAVRVLSVAVSKLQTILKMYQGAAAVGAETVWMQAASRLTEEFSLRLPSIKDIINTFRNIPNSDLMHREAITRLLVLYYEVVPGIALDARFDVSGTLATTMQDMEKSTSSREDHAMCAMVLENLFRFANLSPGMRWFSKVEQLSISPFTAMLRLAAQSPADLPLLKLRSVLRSVLRKSDILQLETRFSALDALIAGMRAVLTYTNATAVFQFIDNCVSRCAAKPIKYIFALEEIHAEIHGSDSAPATVSLLTLAIIEQWPFVLKSQDIAEVEDVARFIAYHVASSLKIGEDRATLEVLLKRLVSERPENLKIRGILEGSQTLTGTIDLSDSIDLEGYKTRIATETAKNEERSKSNFQKVVLEASETREEDPSSLVKWRTKEVDEVIEEGIAATMIMLVSSEHLSLRKEAVTNISKFAARLKGSSYPEKDQIWLLLSEVVESSVFAIDKEPVPTLISSFASHAVAVLSDPLHCLYPKINHFLTQGPAWKLDKIPLMYKILDEEPSLDDAHYQEIAWFLSFLLDGLRNTADMDLCRKTRVFERLFSLYNNSYLAPGLRDKILRILYRATTIEGGSTTLITRFSTLTWLRAQEALTGGSALGSLAERLLDTCDQERIRNWTGNREGKLEAKVDASNINT